MNSKSAEINRTVTGTVTYDPEDRIYPDHFPGNPIVPGSVIIDSFFKAADRAGMLPRGWQVERFRFQRFVSPGTYAYRIQVGSEVLICELLDGEERVAKGRLRR